MIRCPHLRFQPRNILLVGLFLACIAALAAGTHRGTSASSDRTATRAANESTRPPRSIEAALAVADNSNFRKPYQNQSPPGVTPATLFSNHASITLNDANTSTAATPYPSTVAVSGMSGTISTDCRAMSTS